MKKIAILILTILLMCGCANKALPLPEVSEGMRGELGIDKNINEEIISLKEKIRYLTGVNVDNIETLEGAHRRLTKLEAADEEFQTTIDEINTEISSIKNDIKKSNDDLSSLQSETYSKLQSIDNELISLKEQIEYLNGIDSDSLNALDNLNQKLDELEKEDETLRQTTEDLKQNDDHINSEIESSGGILSRLNAAESDLNTKISSPTVMPLARTDWLPIKTLSPTMQSPFTMAPVEM